MASVMAIVSKAVFEKAARGLELGDVWNTDEYASRHKALDALADGGDMVLVTVRPPEQLWLVAVLRDPRANDRGWKAKLPNTTPIRDIDSLRNKLRFVTGAGITVKAGALGMSLQTPRVLADSDVALLSGGPATSAKSTPATSAKSKPAVVKPTSAKSKPPVVKPTSAKSKPPVAKPTSAKSNADAGASIADASTHASRGEWPQAMAALLADWQRAPRGAVADAIVAIDATLPAREIASAQWLAVAKAHDPDALRSVLATIFEAGSKPARERAEALCEWPLDPRVDRWLAGLYDKPVYSSTGARPLWTRLQPLTKRIVDATAIDTIDKARKGNWKHCDFETDFLAEYIDRAKLAKPLEKPLSGDEQRELASIATRLRDATARRPEGKQADELLAQVLADPRDDGARAVLADALVELGDPRGELIALQLAPPTPESTRRANAIIKQHRDALLGVLAPAVTEATFAKGFASRIALKSPKIPAVMHAIAACVGDPLWATVEHLEGPGDGAITPHAVMRSLRSLADSDVPIEQIMQMKRLESLACKSVTKTDVGVIVRGFPALRELSLELALYLNFSAPLAAQVLASVPLAKLASLELAVEVSSYRSEDAAAETRARSKQLEQLFTQAAKSPIPDVTIRVMRRRDDDWSSFYRLNKSKAGLEVAVGMTSSRENWEPLIQDDMLVALDAIEQLRPRRVTLDKPPRVPKIRAAIEKRLSSLQTP
jgi:uncharacterized protein (TIGR02996 family)